MGIAELHPYGAEDHANTMLTLDPGEWVRIAGKDKVGIPADEKVVARIHSGEVNLAYAQTSLHHMEMLLTATATAAVNREICLQRPHGEGIPIALTAPEQ